MQLVAVLEEPQRVSSLDKDGHQGKPILEGEILAEVGQGSRTEAILLALQVTESPTGLPLLDLSTELIEVRILFIALRMWARTFLEIGISFLPRQAIL